MSMPGRDLSQPAKVTMPSNRSACITVSTESAMTSRLTSEARMPSWPMEMPSDTAMVTNSSGKPPAARTPVLGPLGQPVEGQVARGDLVPRRRHADLGLVPVVVGHADGPQHGPGRRPGRARRSPRSCGASCPVARPPRSVTAPRPGCGARRSWPQRSRVDLRSNVGDDPVEPARHAPVGPAEQLHHRRAPAPCARGWRR